MSRAVAHDVPETAEVVAALRRKEEQALAQLHDRYGRVVYALALRITGDAGAAEEISLDTFWQLWQQADRFDGSQGSLQNWLLTIARSRAIDRVRARAARKRLLVEDPTDVSEVRRPEEDAELVQRRGLVRAAMAQLSTDQRDALSLAYYEGLSHAQIAERLQEPLGTVKTRIRQAMGVLRRALAPLLTTP
ncbi:MAG: sigma-70 family RNA polymerase sigma factor [Deltaproteobacteria bacterium]|nr:sigma-70 family RNA polymerase sigma factor [Deltaproteobacteria bacterium]